MNKKPTSITVRLGEDLLHQVRLSAAHNAHSMNAEITRLLRLALRDNPPGSVHISSKTPKLSKEDIAELVRLFEEAVIRIGLRE